MSACTGEKQHVTEKSQHGKQKEIQKLEETKGKKSPSDCFVMWWLFLCCFVTFCGLIIAKVVSARTAVIDRCRSSVRALKTQATLALLFMTHAKIENKINYRAASRKE